MQASPFSAREHLICATVGYMQQQGMTEIYSRTASTYSNKICPDKRPDITARLGLTQIWGFVADAESLIQTETESIWQNFCQTAESTNGCFLVAVNQVDKELATLLLSKITCSMQNICLLTFS